jgi:hypothetical protein
MAHLKARQNYNSPLCMAKLRRSNNNCKPQRQTRECMKMVSFIDAHVPESARRPVFLQTGVGYVRKSSKT